MQQIIRTEYVGRDQLAIIKDGGAYFICAQSRLCATHYAKLSPPFGDEQTAQHFFERRLEEN